MIECDDGPFDELTPRREPGCPAPVELEAFAFAEPHERESASLRSHLSHCARCQSEVEGLEHDRAAFLEGLPPAAFMAQVRAKAERVPLPLQRVRRGAFPVSPRKLSWLAGALAAAALALMVVVPRIEPQGAEDPAELRLRGADSLELGLFVSRAGRPALPLLPDERLVQGDVLRFAARTSRRGYVNIVNVDDRGRVTHYLPQASSANLTVDASERLMPLPGSIRLDAFVGSELVALVISEAPLPADTVVRAFTRAYGESGGRLERFVAPELPAQVTFRIIRKRAP